MSVTGSVTNIFSKFSAAFSESVVASTVLITGE